jgi:hypothetical protein
MTTRVLKHPILTLVGVALAALVTAPAARAFDGVMPVPPGGAHIFAPGPRGRLQGPQANPSSVGDFDGAVALAYLKGRATGGDGHRFLMLNDMRIMSGDYLAADGSRHHGSFAFI